MLATQGIPSQLLWAHLLQVFWLKLTLWGLVITCITNATKSPIKYISSATSNPIISTDCRRLLCPTLGKRILRLNRILDQSFGLTWQLVEKLSELFVVLAQALPVSLQVVRVLGLLRCLCGCYCFLAQVLRIGWGSFFWFVRSEGRLLLVVVSEGIRLGLGCW